MSGKRSGFGGAAGRKGKLPRRVSELTCRCGKPVFASGLCAAEYNREWRLSQGPGSKYRVRAAISSAKR